MLFRSTLVPDAPDVIASNAGWDTVKQKQFLTETVAIIKSWGVRVSLFVDPKEDLVKGAAHVGADRIELYTGPYAHDYAVNPDAAVAPYIKAASVAHESGLGINAGHDLDLNNLAFLRKSIPWLDEVSIGHALICDALYLGLENTIQLYRRCLKE